MTHQVAHDDRYDAADDYMDVVYRLWEESWEEGAVLRDRTHGIFTDPARVHRIRTEHRYRVDAIHLSEPSPQRTPVLFQAGASSRGRQFAATHAECVFVNGSTKKNVSGLVADTRAQAAARGRDPRALAFFVGATVVVGRTEAEAQDKLAEYRAHASVEGALAHFSAGTGIDFAKYDLDEPIQAQQTEANRSNVEAVTTRAEQVWTKRKLIDTMVLGSRQAPMVGSPEQIADALAAWVEEADIDGFNLSRTVMPECVEDFVSLVVPVLQERGLYKTEYAPGTLREKLFGRARLTGAHPAGAVRRDKGPEE